MPEYIQYDKDGKIVNKWYSADPSVVEGKANVLQVTRDAFNALGEFSVVKDGKLTEMNLAEKSALATAKQAEVDLAIAKKQAVMDDLKKIGLKDETIDYLLNSRA